MTNSLRDLFFFDQPLRWSLRQRQRLSLDALQGLKTSEEVNDAAGKLPGSDNGDNSANYRAMQTEIRQAASLLDLQLNFHLTGGEELQWYTTEKTRLLVLDLLTQLSRYLYLWDGDRQPQISRLLQRRLSSTWRELIIDMCYVARVWQCRRNQIAGALRLDRLSPSPDHGGADSDTESSSAVNRPGDGSDRADGSDRPSPGTGKRARQSITGRGRQLSTSSSSLIIVREDDDSSSADQETTRRESNLVKSRYSQSIITTRSGKF